MFEIRAGREEDKGQILELIKDVFGEEQAERAARRWHWQWHEDPRLDKPGYRGVVAEWDGRIIGTLSGIPAGLHIAGQPVFASWFTDNIVHWGHLRRALKAQKRLGDSTGPDLSNGIAAAMLNHSAADYMQLGKHVTGPVEPTLYRIGFQAQKGTGSWARLVSFRQPLETVVGKYAGMLLAALADWVIPRIPQPSLPVEALAGDFDARFDGLWASAKQEYPAITLRDAATLNWRYRRHPDTVYTVLTVEEQGVLVGYLVYSIYFRHKQRRAHIVDILTGRENSAARLALLAAALRHMRREGVHKVECYGNGLILWADLKRTGFAPRLDRGKEQLALARHLPDVELYITRGDGDGG